MPWLAPKKEARPIDISLSDLPRIFDKLFNMKAVEIWNTNVSNFPLLFQILQSFPHLNSSFLIRFRSTGESFEVFWWQKFCKISFVSWRHSSISKASSRICRTADWNYHTMLTTHLNSMCTGRFCRCVDCLMSLPELPFEILCLEAFLESESKPNQDNPIQAWRNFHSWPPTFSHM